MQTSRGKIKWYRKLYLRIRYLGKPTLEEYGTKVEITGLMELRPKSPKQELNKEVINV